MLNDPTQFILIMSMMGLSILLMVLSFLHIFLHETKLFKKKYNWSHPTLVIVRKTIMSVSAVLVFLSLYLVFSIGK